MATTRQRDVLLNQKEELTNVSPQTHSFLMSEQDCWAFCLCLALYVVGFFVVCAVFGSVGRGRGPRGR